MNEPPPRAPPSPPTVQATVDAEDDDDDPTTPMTTETRMAADTTAAAAAAAAAPSNPEVYYGDDDVLAEELEKAYEREENKARETNLYCPPDALWPLLLRCQPPFRKKRRRWLPRRPRRRRDCSAAGAAAAGAARRWRRRSRGYKDETTAAAGGVGDGMAAGSGEGEAVEDTGTTTWHLRRITKQRWRRSSSGRGREDEEDPLAAMTKGPTSLWNEISDVMQGQRHGGRWRRARRRRGRDAQGGGEREEAHVDGRGLAEDVPGSLPRARHSSRASLQTLPDVFMLAQLAHPDVNMSFGGVLYITERHACFDLEEQGKRVPVVIEHASVAGVTRCGLAARWC